LSTTSFLPKMLSCSLVTGTCRSIFNQPGRVQRLAPYEFWYGLPSLGFRPTYSALSQNACFEDIICHSPYLSRAVIEAAQARSVIEPWWLAYLFQDGDMIHGLADRTEGIQSASLVKYWLSGTFASAPTSYVLASGDFAASGTVLTGISCREPLI
jgi:hypothetical protein